MEERGRPCVHRLCIRVVPHLNITFTIGGGGFPPTNSAGQRICRQCGLPGRYKEGKCVEKWGPGPEGPGTVCDRYVDVF